MKPELVCAAIAAACFIRAMSPEASFVASIFAAAAALMYKFMVPA